MKRYVLVIISFFYVFISYGHGGEYVDITDVIITEHSNEINYSFHLINKKGIVLDDIEIKIFVNEIEYDQLKIKYIFPEQKITECSFDIPKSKINLSTDTVRISVTKLFGQLHDWEDWYSVQQKQVNVPGTYEIFADVPWRMKLNNDQGQLNDIPVHCFIHDADGILYASLENIDVYIKSALDTSFGDPIIFDSYTQQDFENLFTFQSTNDSQLDIQEFDISSTLKDADHTLLFVKDTSFFGEVRTIVNSAFWYFTINIPGDELTGLSDIIDVRVDFALNNSPDAYTKMRIFRSAEEMPTMQDYYRGDTHLHSVYTQNSAELGLPLKATKVAAKHIGLDWITTTDHTSDFDNYGVTIQDNWNRLGQEATALNSEDPSLIYIRGQEVALNNSITELVHFLAYPSYSNPTSFPYLGDGNGDLVSTSVSVNSALDSLYTFDGFAYAAHPFATSDKLPTIPVNGGIWNLGDSDFPVNGDDFPRTGGVIICNNDTIESDVLSADSMKIVKDALRGAQIWNDRTSLETTGDNQDPWDVINLGQTTPFSAVDTSLEGYHVKRFRQGQEIVSYVNLKGLKAKNSDINIQNWKLYYSAGADAHGSFNFSNTNDFLASGTISNNAVGKLSTMAYCPNGMGVNGENVLKAMYFGNTSLSDGPILVQGISTDGIDTDIEILMGQDTILSALQLNEYVYKLKYETNSDFGEINEIKVCLGTQDGEYCNQISFDLGLNSDAIDLSLETIVNDVLAPETIPYNEYFYIRSELSAKVDYLTLGINNEHRADEDYFHSFTNPIWIMLESETAINDQDLNNLKVYPNPYKESFTVVINDSQVNKIEVFDLLGKKVESVVINDQFSIELGRDLELGTYLVKIHSEKMNTTLKVVKTF